MSGDINVHSNECPMRVNEDEGWVRGEHSKGRLTLMDIIHMQLDELMSRMDELLVWPTGLLLHIGPPDDNGELWMHVFSTSSILLDLKIIHPQSTA